MSHQGRELLQGLKNFEKGKIVTAREAVQLIRDGDTVATTGFVASDFPRTSRSRSSSAFSSRANAIPTASASRKG